jgi:transposase
MLPVTLPDPNWQTIYTFLKTCPGLYVGNAYEGRRFVEGVLWVSRSGAHWRLLPKA